MRFSPSSPRVAATSWDGTARIWDASATLLQWTTPKVANECLFISSVEPDRRFVAVPCEEHPTHIWDTDQGQLLAELPSVTLNEGDFASTLPVVSSAGERAAIARGNKVEIYELPGGHIVQEVVHDAPVNAIAFSPFGRDLVSGTVDGVLRVTRDTGAVLSLPSSVNGIDATGFLPDGRIVAADTGRRLRIFAPSGEVVADLEVESRVRMFRVSEDGSRLLTVPNPMGAFAAPELWDVAHFRRVARLNALSATYAARFVGDKVFSSSSDASVRVWDKADGKLYQTYQGSTTLLTDATLSADGTMVIGGDGDGFLQFWDAVSGRPLWRMLAHSRSVVAIRVDGNTIVTRGFSGEVSRWTLPEPKDVIDECLRREQCAASLKQ